MSATTSSDREDGPLARAEGEGDFAEFFTAAWPRLYRTALGVAGGDAALAEDSLQNAFAKAYVAWSRVRKVDHPEAYVRRMVVNEVLGSWRQAFRRRERPEPRIELVEDRMTHSAEGLVAERDALWRTVLALPPRQRAVVVLRYYENLSEAEIAQTLGCSRGTVKSQAAAALTRLRHLQPSDDSGGGAAVTNTTEGA